MLLQLPQGSSRLVTVFLGTLWSSVQEVKAPFMFDVQHGIALYAIQVNQASSRSERSLMVFLMLWQEPGVLSQVTTGMALENSCLFRDVMSPV